MCIHISQKGLTSGCAGKNGSWYLMIIQPMGLILRYSLVSNVMSKRHVAGTRLDQASTHVQTNMGVKPQGLI